MAKGALRRDETSFGFREVRLAEKQGLVDAVFDKVAARYDLMNDLMSGGLHRLWKEALVAWLTPPRRTPLGYRRPRSRRRHRRHRLSHCRALADRPTSWSPTSIRRCSPSAGAARLPQRARPSGSNSSRRMPRNCRFADGRFDAVTIAFGIRNVPRIDRALAEAFSVLKPGGRFLCLEFSTVDVAVLDRALRALFVRVIPALGGLVIGDREPYEYLVESIRRFPNQARFAAMIGDAGFARVEYRNLSGGIAAIHSGWKI